jgi:hypothetical protein
MHTACDKVVSNCNGPLYHLEGQQGAALLASKVLKDTNLNGETQLNQVVAIQLIQDILLLTQKDIQNAQTFSTRWPGNVCTYSILTLNGPVELMIQLVTNCNAADVQMHLPPGLNIAALKYHLSLKPSLHAQGHCLANVLDELHRHVTAPSPMSTTRSTTPSPVPDPRALCCTKSLLMEVINQSNNSIPDSGAAQLVDDPMPDLTPLTLGQVDAFFVNLISKPPARPLFNICHLVVPYPTPASSQEPLIDADLLAQHNLWRRTEHTTASQELREICERIRHDWPQDFD